MNTLQKCILFGYILLGPVAGMFFAIMASGYITFGGTQMLVNPHNQTARNQTVDSIRQYIKAHKNAPVYTFNNKFVTVIKPITKGQLVSQQEVQEFDVSSGTKDISLHSLHQEAVGCIANKELKPGQLIALSDLGRSAKANQEPTKTESKIESKSDPQMLMQAAFMHAASIFSKADHQTQMQAAFMCTALILAGLAFFAGLLSFGLSEILLIVAAFRTNIWWGLGYIFVPFASVIFELKFWDRTSRAFHLLTIGFTLLGISTGVFCGAGAAVKQDDATALINTARGEDRIAQRTGVCYATRSLKAGDMFTAECMEVRQVETSNIPLDAIKSPTDAIGMTCRYAIEKGNIISRDEINRATSSAAGNAETRQPTQRLLHHVAKDSGYTQAQTVAADKYVEKLQKYVKSCWHPQVKDQASRSATALFSVSEDGQLSEITIQKSSGDMAYDKSVKLAIARIKSVEKPPTSLDAPFNIQMTFDESVTESE